MCVGFANSYVVKYVEPTNGTREKYPVSEGGLNSGENSVEGVEGEKMSLHFFFFYGNNSLYCKILEWMEWRVILY